MAAALAVVSVADIGKTAVYGNKYEVMGTVAISVSPATYTAGGILMSLAHPLIKAGRAPISVSVQGVSGVIYSYVPGTDATLGKLKIQVQDATNNNPLKELTDASAIPAAVSGDTVNFYAIWVGQN